MKYLIALFKFLGGVSLMVLLVVGLAIPISIYEMPSDLLVANNANDLVLTNATYVDVVTGAAVSNTQIHIANGQIVAIGKEPPIWKQQVRIINIEGAFVSPGLFDMHVHVHDRKYLGLYLAYGVTSVRNLRGLPMHLRWKDELNNSEWLGSSLYTSSPVLDGEKYAHALQQTVTSPEKARQLVSRYKDDGYDLIKAYGYLDKDVFSAITEKAKELDFPVAKHGPNPVEGLRLNANKDLQSLEHVEDIFQGPLNFSFDPVTLRKWVTELKFINPTITPTLATFHHLTQLSLNKQEFVDGLPLETLNPLYRRLLGEFAVNRWLDASQEQARYNQREEAFLLDIVKELDRQDITLLVGSDGGTMYMPAGPSTHLEIKLLEKAGVTPLTIIQAATINAATALNIEDQYGSIQVGKVADLLISKNNPLKDLSTLAQPIAVVKAGQWLSKEDLLSLKESGKNPSNLYVSIGRFLEDWLTRKFH